METQQQVSVDDEMPNVSGQVVFITGGAGGFGKAFAEAFLQNGAKVCVSDINSEAGNKVVEELSSEFGADKVKFSVCDVTKDDSFQAAFDACRDSLGDIDIMINNAGIGNEQNWKLTMEINLLGAIRGSELALKHMSKAKGHNGGRIINVASIAGLKVIPFSPFYGTSKSGIVQYTRLAGNAFHTSYNGVIMQCLCPSLVETPLLAQGTIAPYTEQTGEFVKKLFGKFPLMQVEEIIPAIWKLIKENKPGSVLVVEKNKPFWYCEASIPS